MPPFIFTCAMLFTVSVYSFFSDGAYTVILYALLREVVC